MINRSNIISRFRDLIIDGQRLAATAKVGRTTMRPGVVDLGRFERWRTEGLLALSTVGGYARVFAQRFDAQVTDNTIDHLRIGIAILESAKSVASSADNIAHTKTQNDHSMIDRLGEDRRTGSPETNKTTSAAGDDVDRLPNAGSEQAQSDRLELLLQQARGAAMVHPDLLKRLSGLLPSQFEEVLFRSSVPAAYLPGEAASQTMRAIAAIRYLEQQNRLDDLARILYEVTAGPW